MKTNPLPENRRSHFRPLALAMSLGAGMMSMPAYGQGVIEVGGNGAIANTVLDPGSALSINTGANWTTEGNAAGGGQYIESHLVSPDFVVPTTGTVTLTFDHRFNLEGGNFDGGAIFVSIDGAPATYVPGTSLTGELYDGTATAGTAWPGGEEVFFGTSTGTPAFVQTVADLGVLNAGQTVSVEFRGGWDEGFTPAGTDWEISKVKLTDGVATDFVDLDFTVDGPSGFTVASAGGGNLTNPWVYLAPPTHRFEIDADLLTADTYSPNGAETVINLNGAKIQVALLAGTLDPGDSFTIFSGATLTGSIGDLSLPAGNWDTSAIETTGAFTFLGPSVPTSQLGVLNLAANGGINPNTGLAWAVGDQYRLAFFTNDTTVSTSNDPDFYRNFVTAQAWLNPALQGSYWEPMITLNTSSFYEDEDPAAPILKVKDFTGTGNTTGSAGEPVYVMNGTTCIARNNADIWNTWSNPFEDSVGVPNAAGTGNNTQRLTGLYYSPFLNQNGTGDSGVIHGVDVATGCDSAGNTVRPLGTSANVNPFDINYGSSNANNAGRVWNRFGANGTSAYRLYAISHPLTIYDANEAVLPTLLSSNIVDGQGGADATLNVAPIVYTVTFSEVIDGATLQTTDFGSAGSATFTVDGIRGTLNPRAFEVTVTPTSTGTVQLQVNAAAVITDLAGNALDTTSAILDDTTITVVQDLTAPTVVITDNTSPLPALTNSKITYTVTFSEDMDVSTIDASDFAAVGSAAGTIDSVSYFVDSKVWKVVVSTPATPGTLTLEIVSGAVIKDFVGNLLDTSSAVPDDTTITVNPPVATAASLVNDFQATIASEQHPTYAGEARYFHVSVNPANKGTGSYAATIVGTNNPAPVFVRNYGGDVLSYKFAGGANNTLGVGMEGGNTSLITHTTKDFVFDGFGQQQAKVWDATDPGADLATGGANPYTAAADKNAGLFRSLGGAIGTINISGLPSGSVHIYYGSFSAKPSLRVTMRDLDNVAADIVIANAHSIADGGNNDTADRSEYYLAEIDFVTDGYYDVIEYEWLANGLDYTGNGRGFGTVLTGPEPVSDYDAWAAIYAPADLSDPNADNDGDGLTNNVERLFGLDPTSGASVNPISVALDPALGTFSFTRRNPALTGMFTDIETSFDLALWTMDSGAILTPGAPDGNGVQTVAVQLSPGLLTAPKLFVRVHQNDGTVFSANFEDDNGGFTLTGSPNDWEYGTPNSNNGAGLVLTGGNGGSAKCWATVLGVGGNPSGGITPGSDSILRSPNINLVGAAGAQLQFAAAIDANTGDTIEVLVREVGTDALLETVSPVTTLPYADTNWNNYGPFAIPGAAGKNVYLQFRFLGANNLYNGFYLDDVTVKQTAAP